MNSTAEKIQSSIFLKHSSLRAARLRLRNSVSGLIVVVDTPVINVLTYAHEEIGVFQALFIPRGYELGNYCCRDGREILAPELSCGVAIYDNLYKCAVTTYWGCVLPCLL